MVHGMILNMERKMRMIDDVINPEQVHEPAPSLEHRIKNLEAFTNTLKDEIASVKRTNDELYLETQKIWDAVF